jgi:hypothetical protein
LQHQPDPERGEGDPDRDDGDARNAARLARRDLAGTDAAIGMKIRSSIRPITGMKSGMTSTGASA